jgi:uncharacterized membrane protein
VSEEAMHRQPMIEEQITRTIAGAPEPGEMQVQQRLEASFAAAPIGVRALHGRWLGHPLHAALNDIPIGAFSTLFALDVLEATRRNRRPGRVADGVLALGLVSALVAAVPGIMDSTRTRAGARRAAIVHGVANSIGAMLYGASLIARRSGRRRTGLGLSFLAYPLLLGSAWLGNQMTFRMGVGTRARAMSRWDDRARRSPSPQ